MTPVELDRGGGSPKALLDPALQEEQARARGIQLDRAGERAVRLLEMREAGLGRGELEPRLGVPLVQLDYSLVRVAHDLEPVELLGDPREAQRVVDALTVGARGRGQGFERLFAAPEIEQGRAAQPLPTRVAGLCRQSPVGKLERTGRVTLARGQVGQVERDLWRVGVERERAGVLGDRTGNVPALVEEAGERIVAQRLQAHVRAGRTGRTCLWERSRRGRHQQGARDDPHHDQKA